MWQEEKRRYLPRTVAMTKYHKLDSFKQETFAISQLWRPELKYVSRLILSVAIKENLVCALNF